MSLIKSEKLENSKAELQFTIDVATFDAECQNVYKKQVEKINVPGFRKGKAPRAMIEKMFGKGVFADEALNNLLPTVFEEALKESGFEMISRPDIDVVSLNDNGNVVIKATFDVKPEVTVSAYKGLEAEKTVNEVTDEMIDSSVNSDLQKNAREIEVTDRASELGDTAEIDYEGFVDGVAFEGGKDEHHKLKLGSGSFIPGFEDQVTGKNPGDEFDVNVTFPEDYNAKELAGKAAVFKCKLHTITKEELPTLDDEFAKDMGFDTLDEYKADVKAKLVDRAEKSADMAFENAVVDKLAENVV